MFLTQADVNDCFRNAATRIRNTIYEICEYYDEKGEVDSPKIGREIEDYKKSLYDGMIIVFSQAKNCPETMKWIEEAEKAFKFWD